MTSQDQTRCPRCRRFLAQPGQPHTCTGQLNRCANPRCRRLMRSGARPGELCIRCQVRAALAEATGRPGLPVNTGREPRPRRRP